MRAIARVSEMKDGKPTFVNLDSGVVGIYKFKNRIFAYRNVCPHEGGPAVEGEVMGNTECPVTDGRRMEQSVSKDRVNIVCPWHGIEYDIETGICRAGISLRLSRIQIIVDGDKILADIEN